MMFNMSFIIPSFTAVSLSLIGGTTPAIADIINVPGDFPTIQEAIDASSAGDEIVLALGDYFEGFDLAGTSNITIRSTDPADPDVVAATVVLPASTITITVNAATPTIDGLTFQHPDGDYLRILRLIGDTATTVSNCQFINAGIHFFALGNATILDCIFRDIQISNGSGGAMIFQGNTYDVRVERCRFIDLRIDEGNGTAFYFGNIQGSVSFNDCDFVRNSIGFMPDSTGGWGRGGVVGYLHYKFEFEPALNITINNCRFLGNSCESWHFLNFAAGCTLGLGAGGSNEHDLNVAVANCIFVGNIGGPNTVNIGGSFNSNSSWLINSTFVANESADNVMRVLRTGNEFPVSNCISRDNISALNVWTLRGVSYSNLDGESFISGAQVGNIDADALFVRQPDAGPDGVWGTIDDDYGDLRLTTGSPSIDAADNASVPPDFFDIDSDNDTKEPLPYDLDGNPRFVDDPDTKDTGVGTPPIVDMGAFEFQPALCPQDLDFNGSVGTSDLLALFAQWGTAGSADFDGSGAVGTSDLLILFANWGPCP